jgi:hypothetical protein
MKLIVPNNIIIEKVFLPITGVPGDLISELTNMRI